MPVAGYLSLCGCLTITHPLLGAGLTLILQTDCQLAGHPTLLLSDSCDLHMADS